MDTKDFDQKLVEKIREEKIAPKPRWHFLLKDYVVIAAGVLSLLIGAAAVSVMIYLLKYNGWEMQEQTHKSGLEFFLLTLPYFWIIFLGGFVFVLYYNLKHTKKGYRYPVWAIAISGVLASVVLGSVFYLFGLGQRIDNVLGERAPFYETVMNRPLHFWFNPAEGRLAGVIISDLQDEAFYLADPSGALWQVLLLTKDNDVRTVGFLKTGEPVNIIGQIIAEQGFRADMIKPLVPGRGFFERTNIRGHRERCVNADCPLPFPAAGTRVNIMMEDQAR